MTPLDDRFTLTPDYRASVFVAAIEVAFFGHGRDSNQIASRIGTTEPRVVRVLHGLRNERRMNMETKGRINV